MLRALTVCALLVIWPTVCFAQDPPKQTETIVRFDVKPMAAPKPALKYQLLPELKEMNPGNPILDYLKCFGEQQNFFFNKSAVDDREKWLTASLADLRAVKALHDYGRGPLTRADDAARLDNPDWQLLPKLKKDGWYLLLPEIQQLRNLASCLKLRCRVQVAEHSFDEAIVTTKTNLALARHLGEHPTIIGDLVAIAIAQVALGPVEEMIGEPDCPNLFWAFTNLPHPFIDLRRGMQGDRPALDPVFAPIDGTAPVSAAKLETAVAKVEELVKLNDKKKDVRAWLDGKTKDDNYVTLARKRLIETGLDEKTVQQFPSLQVVLLDEKREYEVRRDERMKWLSLPYWKVEAGIGENPLTAVSDESLLGAAVFAMNKVKKAQARLDQKIAMLAHVEALRLYAADHDSNLPAKLEDIKLPLPVDPFTGKAFLYEVSGATAIIKGSPSKGDEMNPAFNLRYVVTIKK
jgi:hypothetical protein